MYADFKEIPLSDIVKMVWATSIIHLIYANPSAVVNAPLSFAPYIAGFTYLLLIISCSIAFFIVFIIARGIAKDQTWARITFIVFTAFSLPTRIFSLFYLNSMFDDQAKFRTSFFLILAWCIFDIFLVYILSFRYSTEETNTSS